MKDYKASEVRNVSVLGHSGAGKTSILEAMLYYTKASDRFGKTKEGSSLIDYDNEEIKRGISVYTSIVPIEWQDCKINFLDTPGYLDYVGEREAAIEVGDNALIVVSAKDKVQSGTMNAWDKVQKRKIPTILFVNKLDEDNTSFEEAYQSLRTSFGKVVIPFEVPIVEQGDIVGSVNILRNKAWYYKTDKASKEVSYDVPADMQDMVLEYKNQITETVAMSDDELMERFFSGEEFSDAELTRGVRIGVRSGDIVPVFSGVATNSIGIERLMDLIVKYFPTYGERGTQTITDAKHSTVKDIRCAEDEVMSARIFKTIVDPFVGRISYIKVRSGVLTSDSVVYNTKKEEHEKINQIFIIKGKHQTAVGKLFTGDIGAVVKLQHSQTNDTLCAKGHEYIIEDIPFTQGLLAKSVTPLSKNDEDKVNGALAKIVEEDLSVLVKNNPDTLQTIIYGVGEQHLEVIVAKMKSKYKVDVVLDTPRVPYRETIKKTVIGEGRHKKQNGGHGQFGHVFIEFAPNPDVEEMVFEDKVVGGAVPKGYFPAVEAGLRDVNKHGVLANNHVVNMKATLLDGKYHDVDSNEMAFKLAAQLAYKDAMPKANPILLEPIVMISVYVPDEFTGTIIGEMNKRRGMILGMELVDDKQEIKIQVPHAEVLNFATDLRALTQGRGEYTQVFDHYAELPTHLVDKIIEKLKK